MVNQSLLATLLLASTTFAAPTLKKRSFRVPTKHYVSTNPKNIVKRQNGGQETVFSNGGGFLVTAQIGGQDVTLNLDTGSADLWTASTLLPEDVQATITSGQIYNPDDSTTYQPLDGETFNIAYADGSGASGPAALESVSLGAANVPNMPIGVCDTLKYGSGATTRDTDGPVGLAFKYGNSIRPDQQGTFMEQLVGHVDQDVFSTKFTLGDDGYIDFGSSDSSAYSGDLTTIPIDNSTSGNEGSWTAQGVQFGSGGTVFDADPIAIILDTGGPGLDIPDAAASAYFALVDGATNDGGSWTYPCDSTLPDFDFVFTQASSGPTTVTIPGANVKNQQDDGSDGSCSTWIGIADGRGSAGIPFFISNYIIWGQTVPELSFANQADQSTTPTSTSAPAGTTAPATSEPAGTSAPGTSAPAGTSAPVSSAAGSATYLPTYAASSGASAVASSYVASSFGGSSYVAASTAAPAPSGYYEQ